MTTLFDRARQRQRAALPVDWRIELQHRCRRGMPQAEKQRVDVDAPRRRGFRRICRCIAHAEIVSARGVDLVGRQVNTIYPFCFARAAVRRFCSLATAAPMLCTSSAMSGQSARGTRSSVHAARISVGAMPVHAIPPIPAPMPSTGHIRKTARVGRWHSQTSTSTTSVRPSSLESSSDSSRVP